MQNGFYQNTKWILSKSEKIHDGVDAENLRHNTRCDCSNLTGLAQPLCGWSSAKGKAPQSDGDSGGVSTTGTPMLKLVMPKSKQAAKVGDGIGAAAGYASDVRQRIKCCDKAPPPARAGTTCEGRPVRVNIIDPGYYLTRGDLLCPPSDRNSTATIARTLDGTEPALVPESRRSRHLVHVGILILAPSLIDKGREKQTDKGEEEDG
ncbi:hypothetical protein TIFTF001_011077 [Ficus carica]|uniref:Uncharacterized protein n=1 Tax=Ficus carica TaxID=3494 RepID=A0AA87ZZ97_FICCA|nr:hypothetical protein TIFTF001_011077 [Ficus carica]